MAVLCAPRARSGTPGVAGSLRRPRRARLALRRGRRAHRRSGTKAHPGRVQGGGKHSSGLRRAIRGAAALHAVSRAGLSSRAACRAQNVEERRSASQAWRGLQLLGRIKSEVAGFGARGGACRTAWSGERPVCRGARFRTGWSPAAAQELPADAGRLRASPPRARAAAVLRRGSPALRLPLRSRTPRGRRCVLGRGCQDVERGPQAPPEAMR